MFKEGDWKMKILRIIFAKISAWFVADDPNPVECQNCNREDCLDCEYNLEREWF